MKFQRFLTSILVVLLIPLASRSASELVKGSFDSKNDWFVFSWRNSENAEQTSILDIGNKVIPSLHAEVIKASDGAFKYQYEFGNEQGALQNLQDIYVSHSSPIFAATSPSPQSEWHMGEDKTRNAWHWARVKGNPLGIQPGHSMSGFSFKSKGLPTVVNVQFAGQKRGTYIIPGDDDPEGTDESFGRGHSNLKTQYPEKFEKVARKTVGPIDPPLQFAPVSATDNVIALAKQANDLGWIIQGKEEKKDKSDKKDPGILNSFLEKLDHAKLEITKNKLREAIEVLRSLVNEVDALYKTDHDKDKHAGKKNETKEDKFQSHLTSEAYALLKYNTEYVIDQISKSLPKETSDNNKRKDKK